MDGPRYDTDVDLSNQNNSHTLMIELVGGTKRVLDVGCGSGRFSVSLAKKGSEVVGLDFAEDMIALARRAAADAGVADRCTFLRDDFLTWETDTPFDLALAIGVFDYVAEPEPLLAKLVSVSGGRLIASFPRRLHPLAPLRYVRLRATGCPVHFYDRGQVDALARQHLTSYRIVPFHRDHLLVAGV